MMPRCHDRATSAQLCLAPELISRSVETGRPRCDRSIQGGKKPAGFRKLLFHGLFPKATIVCAVVTSKR